MKKILLVLAVIITATPSLFAMGSTSGPEKAYGNCLVAAMSTCAQYSSKITNWNDINSPEYQAYIQCKAPLDKTCGCNAGKLPKNFCQ